MKLSESEFRKFCKDTGYPDPAITEAEDLRKKRIALRILLDAGTQEDKQALEYWRARIKEQKLKEREAARIARSKSRRSPAARPVPFLTLPPYRPFRFDAAPAFRVPKQLTSISRDCMKQFRF